MKSYKKKIFAVLLSLSMIFTSCGFAVADVKMETAKATFDETNADEVRDYVPGEIIVCLKGGETAEEKTYGACELESLLDDPDALTLFECSPQEEDPEDSLHLPEEKNVGGADSDKGNADEGNDRILLIHIDEDDDVEATAEALSELDKVEFAQPNYINKLAGFVDTPEEYTKQWAFENDTPYGVGREGTRLMDDASLSFKVNDNISEYDEDEIVVAVVDSGIEVDNPELANVMWQCPEDLQETLGCGVNGYNAAVYTAEKSDGFDDISDQIGHGTHVAGIIGADRDEYGIYGIANDVKIMGVKVADGSSFTDSAALSGLYFVKKAIKAGVNIAAVNCSWGSTYNDFAIERAVNELGALGTLTVFSAGNDSKNLDYYSVSESCFGNNPYVVTVDAHGSDGHFASFTNYGLKSTDVSAPGVSIISAAAKVNATIDYNRLDEFTVATDSEGKQFHATMDTAEKISSGKVRDGAFEFSAQMIATVSGTSIGAHVEEGDTVLAAINTVSSPSVQLYIDFSDTGLDESKPHYFGGQFVKAGWLEPLPTVNYHKLTLTVDIYKDGKIIETKDTNYNIAYGNPTSFTSIVDAGADGMMITVKLQQYSGGSYKYYDPGYVAFDNFIITEDCLTYVSMNGTSMAAPMVTGEAAVLAAKFARTPEIDPATGRIERAKELKARIMGSVVPFEGSEHDFVKSGGYISLAKAVDEDYKPVIQTAEYDSESEQITLHGYFLPTPSQADDYYILADNSKIENVEWSESGRTATFDFSGTNQGAKEYAFYIMSADDKMQTRNFIYVDTGSTNMYMMDRIAIDPSTDPRFANTTLIGMAACDGKLYMYGSLTDLVEKKSGCVMWSYDLKKKTPWQRVSETTVNGRFLGNEDLKDTSHSNMISADGKLLYAMQYQEPVTGTYMPYIIVTDPKKGTVKAYQVASENLPNKLSYMQLACTGDGFVFQAYISADAETIMYLYKFDENGELERTATHLLDLALRCDLMYGEDGTLYSYGALVCDEHLTSTVTLCRWTVDENTCEYEILADELVPYDGTVANGGKTETNYTLESVAGGIIITGVMNTLKNDVYHFDYETGEIEPLSRNVADSKLYNIGTAIYNGVYYVLASTRNSEEGKMVFACRNLSDESIEEIPNPGDSEDYDPNYDPDDDDDDDHGGGTGDSGGGSGSTSKKPAQFAGTWGNPLKEGSWVYHAADNTWSYTTAGGSNTAGSPAGGYLCSTWAYIFNPYATAGQPDCDWFYFNKSGKMLTGWWWITDSDGVTRCYYLNPVSDNRLGACQLGGITPDGYTVDANGAWTVDGKVQSR